MDETFASKVVHWVAFLAICTSIIIIGWSEPLRYRFMSRQEIAEAENPDPGPPPQPWIERRRNGALEKGPEAVRFGR